MTSICILFSFDELNPCTVLLMLLACVSRVSVRSFFLGFCIVCLCIITKALAIMHHRPLSPDVGTVPVKRNCTGTGTGTGNGCAAATSRNACVCNDSVEVANAVDFSSSRDTDPGHSEASEPVEKQRVNRVFAF